MITKTIRTTSGKMKIAIPAGLSEVTFGQLMKLQEKPSVNDLEAISILAGLPLNDLQNVCNVADLEIFGDAVLLLTHQVKQLYNSDDVPKTVEFTNGKESKTVNVINNLSVEPAGAFMAAREIIAEEINGHIKQYGGRRLERKVQSVVKSMLPGTGPLLLLQGYRQPLQRV